MTNPTVRMNRRRVMKRPRMANDYANISRLEQFLLDSFGDDILKFLDDETVNEVYVNEDYRVWKDTIYGRFPTDVVLNLAKVKSVCEAIAGINAEIISTESPILGVEIRNLHIRAQVIYPPILRNPIFFLRKKPAVIFSLEDYVSSGTLSQSYYEIILDLIKRRKNVVVAGATGSGKTTFVNAILKKLAEITPEHRLVILEDTPEIQFSSKDVLRMCTTQNKGVKITMDDLLFASMRLSPHRIIVGEVRNGAAYTMLKAWNTGHEGGFCTVHANSTENTFIRLEALAREAEEVRDKEVARQMIGESVDAIISIQKYVETTGTTRKIDDIIVVDGYDSKESRYIFSHI